MGINLHGDKTNDFVVAIHQLTVLQQRRHLFRRPSQYLLLLHEGTEKVVDGLDIAYGGSAIVNLTFVSRAHALFVTLVSGFFSWVVRSSNDGSIREMLQCQVAFDPT